jgi:serine/threonine protein kinase
MNASEVYKARSKKTSAVVALKKILMHNEKDGVCLLQGFPFPPQILMACQFPITALREIKLLKMLQHTNILRLDEMAIEKNRGLKPLFLAFQRFLTLGLQMEGRRSRACTWSHLTWTTISLDCLRTLTLNSPNPKSNATFCNSSTDFGICMM